MLGRESEYASGRREVEREEVEGSWERKAGQKYLTKKVFPDKQGSKFFTGRIIQVRRGGRINLGVEPCW
jgi:hypothetical protein